MTSTGGFFAVIIAVVVVRGMAEAVTVLEALCGILFVMAEGVWSMKALVMVVSGQ